MFERPSLRSHFRRRRQRRRPSPRRPWHRFTRWPTPAASTGWRLAPPSKDNGRDHLGNRPQKEQHQRNPGKNVMAVKQLPTATIKPPKTTSLIII